MLRFSSCQAEIAESFCAELAAFIGDKLAIQSEFIGDIPWQEMERLLLCGDIHVNWVCGLAYVRKRNPLKKAIPTIELLAAPVRSHPRYGGRPDYYSDVVVHADSSLQSFEDLSGKTWGFNEPASHSGYNIMRYHLAMKGWGPNYFGRAIETGSHRNSIQMILQRTIDAAAIDSTVLELELEKNPSIIERIRTIKILGPSPAPPWVVHGSVPTDVQQALRQEFLAMDKDPRGRQILESAKMFRFAPVADHDYDPIREMERIATIDLANDQGTPKP